MATVEQRVGDREGNVLRIDDAVVANVGAVRTVDSPVALYAPQPEQHCLSFHHCVVGLLLPCTSDGPTTQMPVPETVTATPFVYDAVVPVRS
jgi:hypothetical protein